MADLTAEEVREYLTRSSPAELLKILAPVLAARSSRHNGIEERLVLCSFYRCDFPVTENESADRWAHLGKWSEPTIVAPPPTQEDWQRFESQGYWESGQCTGCNHPIESYAKHAVCPLCDSAVKLT